LVGQPTSDSDPLPFIEAFERSLPDVYRDRR
jgi:hypothetical protein